MLQIAQSVGCVVAYLLVKMDWNSLRERTFRPVLIPDRIRMSWNK
ncbi:MULTISPECIES: hypothetical protein [unclassified Siphonobacter]|nr:MULTISPECIES: hypothetical protein [unclassified Siphonobacter]